LKKLQQESGQYHREILGDRPSSRPDYTPGNWIEADRATRELMQQGVEAIDRAALLAKWQPDVDLLSFPDRLVKIPYAEESEWGDWIYIPEQIEFGKRPKLDYQVVAAFDAFVLASVQGVWPPFARLILRDRAPFNVDLDYRVPLMYDILSDCVEMFQQRAEPEVFISRQKCSLCAWLPRCQSVARSLEHLCLLPGVTSRRYEQLKDANLDTLEALANASLSDIEIAVSQDLPNAGISAEEIARQLFLQSRSTFFQRPFATEAEGELPPVASFYLEAELYFDIEAQPDLDLNYLLGVFVVDRRHNSEKFYAFVAENPEEEERVWHEFLQLVDRYPHAPIFHFGDYETKTIRKLGKRYKTPATQWQDTIDRCVDMREWIDRAVVLPVENYSLKTLAQWMGFSWRDASASGAQSICWYDRWLETGDRSYLDAIIEYNEDDCRATYRVRQWLADFLSTAVSA